ncbi:MAG: GNAT family N-acetyltransferase [Polyangiaceae bacterium]|nr:GNAT family N-acetyltransferase [Polyangiaceae bacterium]
MSKFASVVVRAANPSEGPAVAGLWRELWDIHETWGGYIGSRDPRVYEQLAERLSNDFRTRSGQPVLGRHVHLVAATSEGIIGQVEGWFDRHGVDETTPYTCEVRSLIVSSRARTRGAGRALLRELGRFALQMSRGSAVVMAAEVLEPNPAHTFYAKAGYVPVSWAARVSTASARDVPPTGPYVARRALPADALSIAFLDPTLAARRRLQGDVRFDRPRAVDATFVGALASHLARPRGSQDPYDIVVVDQKMRVRANATLLTMSLDPPFLPTRRALLGRFALDPALPAPLLVAPLIRFARRVASARGACMLELVDLDPPGNPLYEAMRLAGGVPWSRLVERYA